MSLYSIDIETTGLNAWKDQITCIGVWHPKASMVFRDLKKFASWFKSQQELKHHFVLHNGKFDFKFLLVNKLVTIEQAEIMWAHDTQYLAHVMADKVSDTWLEIYEEKRAEKNKVLPVGIEHRKGGKNSLKCLAPYFLNVDPFWENPADHNNDEYVLKDCEYTYRLFEQFYAKGLASDSEVKFYQEKMMPWAKMLLKAELAGIKLDSDLLTIKDKELQVKVIELEQQLNEVWTEPRAAYRKIEDIKLAKQYFDMQTAALKKIPEEKKTGKRNGEIIERYQGLYEKALKKIESLSYDSPKQMLWLMKDYFKLDVSTETGESTGRPVLEKLASQGRNDFKLFLEYRETQKLITSFIEPYKHLRFNGEIHPEFNLTGTRTGRLSSSNPNLQQVPPELNGLFQARPGHVFVQYDMGAIEAKLIAYYSDDIELYKIIKEGLSIHDVNTLNFFELDIDPKEVKKKFPNERHATKQVGFACFYGAGWRRIQQTLLNFGFNKTDNECKEIYKRIQKRFQGAFEFHREITECLLNREKVINLLGRPISIEHPEDCYMKGFNTLVQSSASDLVLWSALKSGLKILLLVHDFILAEVPEAEAQIANSKLVKAMTDYKLESSHGPIVLDVEGSISKVWGK